VLERLKSPEVFWAELGATWRVLVIVLLAQLAASVVSANLRSDADWSHNLWCGGALATLPAVLIGLAWQFATPERRHTNHKEILILYFVASTFISLMAVTRCLVAP
jgi:hypothetical protein